MTAFSKNPELLRIIYHSIQFIHLTHHKRHVGLILSFEDIEKGVLFGINIFLYFFMDGKCKITELELSPYIPFEVL